MKPRVDEGIGSVRTRTFEELVAEAEGAHFGGWDFTYLEGRFVEDKPSWNYPQRSRERIKGAKRMLDMGTGGGELLSTLQPLPAETYATEGYPPNVAIAKSRLEPIGVRVVPVDSTKLPFPNQFFDLIINRHEEYSPNELYRTLTSDGFFVTQQVGGRNLIELVDLLDLTRRGKTTFSVLDWSLKDAVRQLKESGLEIVSQKEEYNRGRFQDIGALVYLLKVVPWDLPDFSVSRYREELRQIHQLIQETGSLEVTSHRFFIEASKEQNES